MRSASLVFRVAALLSAATSIAFAQPGRDDSRRHDEDPARLFEEVDLDGDGRITRAEVQARAGKLFDEFASAVDDTDGALDMDEFVSAITLVFSEGDRDPMQEFDRMDLDGDGFLSADELDGQMRGALAGWMAERGRTDTRLSRSEFPAFAYAVFGGSDERDRGPGDGGPSGRRGAGPDGFHDPGPDDRSADPDAGTATPQNIFAALDQQGNGDGLLSLSELPDTVRPHFELYLAQRGLAGSSITPEQFLEMQGAMNRRPGPESDRSPGRSGGPGDRPGPEYGRDGLDRGGPPSVAEDTNPAEFSRGRAFDRYDANNDALLTLDEIPADMQDHFRWMLDVFERDDDDGLTREEFVRGASERAREQREELEREAAQRAAGQ